MSSYTRLRVVICGAGIGGLTAAGDVVRYFPLRFTLTYLNTLVALSAYPDIEVEIYEAATKLTEVGAGIGLFPRPWEVIQKLGLEEELLKFSEVKRREGPGNLMTFHRADFQQVLLRRLPKSYRTHYCKRFQSYSQQQSGPIKVVFEDGSTTTCDVLVGADGLKSAVRKALILEKVTRARSEGRHAEVAHLGTSIDPVWTGTNAYRALIPSDILKKASPDHRVFSRPTQYLGKHGYIIAYPISKGKFINFVAFTSRHDLEHSPFKGSWVSTTDPVEFSGIFSGWEAEAQDLISCVTNPLRWAVHAVRPLDSFASGGVALIGDAAHAMEPHQGSGAGQAIEDAYILATVLGHPSTTRATLHDALQIFDNIRRPQAQRVAEMARRNGRLFTFHERDLDCLSNGAVTKELRLISEEFTRNWEWAWSTSPESSKQEAIRLLESLT
ncbi:hypothetical protein H0H92_011709 [Tricholoma furcatifolium]|nr:hypothetical protein H0H92_011709 [Tricholoma furcatifolium]